MLRKLRLSVSTHKFLRLYLTLQKWEMYHLTYLLLFSAKIEQEDLEDYISEILYNEFDTVVEDGSLEKVNFS